MKKLFKFVALCAMALATLSACEEGMPTQPQPGDTENPDNPGTGEKPGDSTSPLTPDEHKQKLENIAIEFVDEFNTADFEALIGSLSYFEDLFEVDDEMVEVPGDEYIDETTRALKSFSVAGVINAVTRASEQFIFDINDEDFDFNGAVIDFTEDSEEPSFEYDGNLGECVVKWEDSVATFSWGETKGQYTYIDEEEDVEYIVNIPAYINLSLKISGVEHLNINVEPNYTDNHTYAPKITIKLNGGYEIVCENIADNQKLSCAYSLSKNGKRLAGAVAAASIKDFTNPENWYYEYYDDYYNEYITEIAPDIYFEKNVTNGSIQIDILTLTLTAAGDFTGMYDKIEAIEDKYNWWDETYTVYDESQEKAYYNDLCELINNTVEFVALYNDTNEKIADIKVQPRRSVYDEGDIDYEIDLVLVFPDGSKHVMQDYFTADSFEDLMNHLSEKFGE
ncbi:MAG: hypothetical protein J6V05_02075 [Alistipes sp.]|nr:hypothetical protein [Alistipes sp.]